MPPIKRRESPYSTIECAEIDLGRFGPEKRNEVQAFTKNYISAGYAYTFNLNENCKSASLSE